MIKFFRKYHKWLGIVFTVFIVMFAFSGIILNHRKLFSPIDINRKLLPKDYQFENWNNAAVRNSISLDDGNTLIYGNIGIWKTDSTFSNFSEFMEGLPRGIDNRKISKIFKTKDKQLYAGTYFGLYKSDLESANWEKVEIPLKKKRVVDISEKGDTLLVLTRSVLLKTVDGKSFTSEILPEPENYDNKIGLFKTLWVIHSGEIYGLTGKLIVDAMGIVFIFLSITGLIFFINRYRIRKRKKKAIPVTNIAKSSKWNLTWHNKIGWITTAILILTTVTGMFLRPPLLIAIARSKMDKIPYSMLDSPNPWFDKLRAIHYDEANQQYMIGTSDGMHYSDDNFKSPLKPFEVQPPISVMGINVFEKIGEDRFLLGSFSGIFEWQPKKGIAIDRITGKPYKIPSRMGPPVGQHTISGIVRDYKEHEIYFDYGRGALSTKENVLFPKMPESIKQTPMSLWNFSLEVHTARIYKPIFGRFYVLVIPLSGLFILFVIVSGFVVWLKRHRKK